MRHPAALPLLLGVLLGALAAPRAEGKDAKPPAAPKTGKFQMTAPPPFDYLYMAVPADYDPSKFYPLVFLLHPMTDTPDQSKPEPYVDVWAKDLLARGWIVAAPKAPQYDNEESINPILDALRSVKRAYHVDEQRVVLVGHNAGALMAWRMASRSPNLWAGVAAFSGEIHQADRTALKGMAGKPVYLFRGAKDDYYTDDMMKADEKFLAAAKAEVTKEVKLDWRSELPIDSVPKIAAWIDGVWPPGAYREKAQALEAALTAKDVAAAQTALSGLQADLKKSPYPAFAARAKALGAGLEALAKAQLDEVLALVEADPLVALERAEATAKAWKAAKPWDAEAAKAVATLRKHPAVVEALRKKEAETSGASYMERGSAAEAKGDLAKALEWFRKAAALAWSRTDEAKQKVAELEAKAGGK